MINNDLTHSVTFTRRVASGTNSYNEPTYTETSLTEICFYDIPKEGIYITEDENKVSIEAIIFMLADSSIEVDDYVTLVKDSRGNTISDQKLRVASITRVADNIGVHHLEIKLVKA